MAKNATIYYYLEEGGRTVLTWSKPPMGLDQYENIAMVSAVQFCSLIMHCERTGVEMIQLYREDFVKPAPPLKHGTINTMQVYERMEQEMQQLIDEWKENKRHGL